MILGFNPKFVPYVRNGTKRHTIRDGWRWHAGMRGDLYENVRQKNQTLIFRSIITLVEPIEIFIHKGSRLIEEISIGGDKLDADEMEAFAYADGFRDGYGFAGNRYLREMSWFWLNVKRSGAGRKHSQLIHWDYERRFR